jgi:hypothetical protein
VKRLLRARHQGQEEVVDVPDRVGELGGVERLDDTSVGVQLVAGHVIGADTHMDTHTAALCDARGRVLSRLQVTADPAGYASLLAWAQAAASAGRLAWAVESTRHYGLGLARHLARVPQCWL